MAFELNISNFETLSEFLKTETNGLYWIFFLIVIFIIVFISTIKFGFDLALLCTSFGSFIMATIFWSFGGIGDILLIVFLLIFILSIVKIFVGKS